MFIWLWPGSDFLVLQRKRKIKLEKNNSKLETCLNEFKKLEKNYGNGTPYSITLNNKKHKGHIVFSGIVHGNEVGSLPAIIKCIHDLLSNKINYGGKVSFFLGNIEAAQNNVRFIESDLNRSFGNKYNGQTNKERSRALEIMPLLSTADVYFDFHQTIMPCLKPFYIFEMSKQSYYWARAAGVATTFVTRKKGASFSAAGMCSDEYVRSFGNVGITIELGEKGFSHEAETMSFEIMKRALNCMNKVYGNHFPIEKLAHKNMDFEFLSIVHREPFLNPKLKLNEGLLNFKKVTEGMALGLNDQNKPLISPRDGYILFPKYPMRKENGEAILPLPGEIYVIADQIKEHPLEWE
jgi:succinylglutamate desuccinylase